jgi:hypothetical protein
MTALLDMLGASSGVGQTTWSWNIQDRTRAKANISGATINGSLSSATFTTDLESPGYFIVGDTVRSEAGKNFRVTALGASGGFQTITVVKVGGGNIATSDINNSEVISHIGSQFEEGSEAPDGRVFTPTEDYNNLHILRRSHKITGTAFTDRTWLNDGKSWYFTIEDLLMKEFALDRELTIMFGTRDNTSNRKATRGILDYVLSSGIVNTYSDSTGLTENDIQEQIRLMMIEGCSNEITVLCGSAFMADVQRALKDYHINGAIDYGKFKNNTFGLDVQHYFYMGKTIHFTYYQLFDDAISLPFSGAPTASKIDFSKFSLWVDLGGDDSGRSLIQLKHKELGGVSRKFIMNYEAGMMSPSGVSSGLVSNGFDGFKVNYLSEIGVEVRLANRMGILRAL